MEHSDDDCISALRAALSDLDVEQMVRAHYGLWRLGRADAPSSETIAARLGGWGAALAAAGLDPSAPLGGREGRGQPGPMPFTRTMRPCPYCGGSVEKLTGTRVEGDKVVQRGRCNDCREAVSQALG